MDNNGLNKHLQDQESQEKALEEFQELLKNDLDEIETMIHNAKIVAKDFKGYDFSEDLVDMIRDVTWKKVL